MRRMQALFVFSGAAGGDMLTFDFGFRCGLAPPPEADVPVPCVDDTTTSEGASNDTITF